MISVNVNSAASGAGLSLGKSNDALQKSLARLSSGRRIVNSSDDAGGLAVSMKMAAAQRRTDATGINLQNIQSFLQTQDGAFTVADNVLARMSELTTLARDITKNGGDVENYDKEFGNLKAQMRSLATEKFNGVNIFFDGLIKGKTVEVPTSEDGSQVTSLTQAPINADPMLNMMTNGYKKFSIQNQTFFAERINDEAEIYKDGPQWDPSTKSSTVKNIFTLPDGTSKTLNIASDPITEPVSPVTTAATAGAASFVYTFGLNYELEGADFTENLPLIYPANTSKAVDDFSKPIFDSTPSPVLDSYGYPTYMPLDDKMKPIPNISGGPTTGNAFNIVGSINTSTGSISYTTPNSYTPGQPIGLYENGNTSSVVYYTPAVETYTTTGGVTTSQYSYEDQKGVPPFIWREVKANAGIDNPNGSMRWFNTSTGDYTRSLPAGGNSPLLGQSPSSLTGFGYGEAITPPQYSSTNADQETQQGMDFVHRLLSARINGVASSTNLNNDSTHNTNLVYDNSSDYGSISQLALQQLADMRAQNGSESSRVNFSQDLLKINSVNLEAANSRIMDVDIAAESSQLSRFQILQQAGTAMLAQANTSHQSLLKLLQG
jgi:flagellin-like hook-associated protein FlgL